MQHTQRSKPTLDEIDVFSCESGCVHFEFGSTMLTFDRETFLHIAEVFAETKAEMLTDEKLTGEWTDELTFEGH